MNKIPFTILLIIATLLFPGFGEPALLGVAKGSEYPVSEESEVPEGHETEYNFFKVTVEMR